MIRIFPAIIFALVVFVFSSCNQSLRGTAEAPPARNVILLIGDGMGLAQVSSVFYTMEEPPAFTRFKHIGLHRNAPTDAQITDSAAGATAFATGYKSYNAAIGVDSDTTAQETIVELLSRQGLKTGLVATSSITHATPASFYAHVPSRNLQDDIAVQLADSPVDFFAGGGLQFFNQREDGQDILPSLSANGFTVDTSSLDQPAELTPDQKYAYLLAADGMPKMQEGRGDFLPHATHRALDYLSQNDKGFFLMVEGSQIDWGGHANDATYIVQEMKDFEKTIDVALDFAEENGNTLVLVTADHETGGFALSAAEVRRQADYRHIRPTFSTGGHTASLIPVFAFGPGAENFNGIYENQEIFNKMLQAMKR